MRLSSALAAATVVFIIWASSDPLSEALAVPERSVPSAIALDLSWRGDTVGVARLSGVYRALSIRERVALLRLESANVFTTGGIGSRGSVSPQARAFRILLFSSNGTQAFLQLCQSVLPVAQLYGLAGLRLSAPDRFREQVASGLLRPDVVMTLQGCIGRPARASEVLGTGAPGAFEIRNGTWPRDLAGLPSGA